MPKFGKEPAPEQATPQPEQHHKEMWDKIKDGKEFGYADTLKRGKELGIATEELENCAHEVVLKKIGEKDFLFVFRFGRFMRNIGVGTDETIKELEATAYKEAMQGGYYDDAANLALELYGQESAEYLEAIEAWKKMAKQPKKQPENRAPDDETEEMFKNKEEGPVIYLKQNATLADLFASVDRIEEKAAEGTTEGEETEDGPTHFEEELFDHFDDEIANDILDLRARLAALSFKKPEDYTEEEKTLTAAGEEKLLEYFIKKGYSKEDIEAFLPIKFKKKKKK